VSLIDNAAVSGKEGIDTGIIAAQPTYFALSFFSAPR
jgi:hypothetical protein